MILKNFWVLEGLDGSGTTTQLKKISQFLAEKHVASFITQEPTTGQIGKLLRRVLSGEIKCSQSTIAHLFSADRDDHLFNPENGIMQHLENGETVVSDRYFFSSFAYQSVEYEYSKIEDLNKHFPYPEKLFFIDTPVDDCLERINSRGDAKEIFEKYDYQKKVKENYEKCFSNLPSGCSLIRIDGRKSIDDIFKEIKEHIS